MQNRQGTVLETLRRAQRFLDDHTALLEAVNTSTARQKLDAVVSQLATHATEQGGGARESKGETAKQRRLRLTLRADHMRPIAAIAEENLPKSPELKALGMPKARLRGAALSADARAMADAAIPFAATFIEHGLPSSFIEDLRDAAQALDRSIDLRNRSRDRRAGATQGLVAAEKHGRRMLVLINSLVQPRLRANDRLLGEWNALRRLRRRAASTPPSDGTVPIDVGAPPVAA
jgi:hypothetical protein